MSSVNVLNSKHIQESDKSPTVPSHIKKMHQSMRREARDNIGKLYSRLLRIMTSGIVEALSKESLRQGAVTPEVLYLKLYDATQDAGYNLQWSSRIMVREWLKLQQDASKWEEIKAQYEKRRTRLLDAPRNIERLSAVALIDSEQNSIGDMSTFPRTYNRHVPTASSTNVTASAFTILQQSQSNSPKPTPTPAPISSIMSPFSLFSSLMPSQRGSSTTDSSSNFSVNTTANSNPTVKASPTQVQPSNLPYQSNASCNEYQISRYLTALDNGMLEECINHKQFKYGWEQVYERMGLALGDKGTAKIAMRLCKRAFLGHGGLGPNQRGSPNIQAKDMCFGDELPAQDDDCNDCNDGDDDDDESEEWKRFEEKLKKTSDKHIITPAIKKVKQEGPEVREARAWVIYSKAMISS
ncbi:hypothetical protein BGZ79_003090 [Entomortierella chlamydospora]|nr:hypothetical protein BGZ79_003090 [Entomortierella chlamydospora]